jgi:chromosome segregation ATPase
VSGKNEMLDRIEALTKLLATTNEQLEAARYDAKEAEAYAEELERYLKTCRMAQAVMDNTVAELELKSEFFEEEWVSAVDKLNKAIKALDGLLEAITATTQHGDRSLTITGPTANLKWLLEMEEEARTTLAEIEGTNAP